MERVNNLVEALSVEGNRLLLSPVESPANMSPSAGTGE